MIVRTKETDDEEKRRGRRRVVEELLFAAAEPRGAGSSAMAATKHAQRWHEEFSVEPNLGRRDGRTARSSQVRESRLAQSRQAEAQAAALQGQIAVAPAMRP